MSLNERLRKAAIKTLEECGDNSKEILRRNIVNSFDEMGMANTKPGEFSQEEITDKENLCNVSKMSNDTGFNDEDQDFEIDDMKSMIDITNDLMSDVIDISSHEDDHDHHHHHHPHHKHFEMHGKIDKDPEVEVLEFGESYMGKVINNVLENKTCEDFLMSLNESNYSGPRDWNPDTRIGVADVVAALKQQNNEGFEAVHVDVVQDKDGNPAYKVSQVEKNLLPKNIDVETISLKLGDDNIYYRDKMSDNYPMPK